MQKQFIIIGSILAALGVILGAFGAHALKDILINYNRTDTFDTAVKYHFYHAFGLLIIGILSNQFPDKNFNIAGYLIIAGVIIFSGSLYVLCLTNIKWLGAITPIGGLLMIMGWSFVVWKMVQK